MCKNPIKARLIISSTKSFTKPLFETITSNFHLLFRQTYNDKCKFFSGVNIFLVVQSKKPANDAMNKLIKSPPELLFYLSLFHLVC